MKNLTTTLLFVCILGTGTVLADTTAASKLDINRVLPQTIRVEDTPPHLRTRKLTPTPYSPQQKAKIVGMELKSI